MCKKDCLAIWTIVVALFYTVTLAQTGDLPVIEIPECKSPPILDGVLNDSEWQSAEKITMYQINGDLPAPETEIYLLRDNAWLYMGARCRNANMPQVTQKALKNEGPVNLDESVELFVRPSINSNTYCHFMLSFANVRGDRLCTGPKRDAAWESLWRTATKRQTDGWTAEAAIPLFSLNSTDLGNAQINILRNFIKIDLDKMGAVLSEKRVYHVLKTGSIGSAHDFNNFVAVTGLGGFKPIVPFAPQIQKAAITGVQQDDGANYYSMELTLATATPEMGSAQLKIIENFGDDDVETYVQPVELHGVMDLSLKIPAGMLRERSINVVLTDPDNGNLLAAMAIDDTSALRVLKKVFVGRSYYTSEESAEIRVELGLPGSMLPDVTLIAELGDAEIMEWNGLSSEMTLAIPLPKLAMGDNKVRVRVLIDGRELAAQTLNIVRLEPRPGYETKADFIRGALLKDNQPYFSIALFGHTLQRRLGMNGSKEDDEDLFRFLAEDIGLNTIVRIRSATNTVAFLSLAEKYGLNVITWTSPQPEPIGWKPGTWPPPPCDLPLAERLAIQQKEYDAEEPEIIADTKILRDYKNFVIYYNVDEPNLLNPDERIAGAERYWNTITPLDPYRPQLLAYSAYIPPGDNWTRWCDILGYDIYPMLFKPDAGVRIEPGLSTAYYAYQLRERCRRDNKIMWFVPLSNMLDPARSPIGLSKTHMLCQTYSAIIYGARGFIYFALSNTFGEDAWDGLRTIATQVKAMSPALLNGDIAQNIKYSPDNFQPNEQKFPAVNAAVFRYPDGDYLLLAVNIKPHAVDTTFTVGGLRHTARMFAGAGQMSKGAEEQKAMELAGESFTDKIEPYGTRAYRMKIAPRPTDAATSGISSSAPVEVSLNMTPLEEEVAPSVDIAGIVRQLMMGKNFVPNPCFERQFNPGIPDFFRPFFCMSTDPTAGQKGSSWFVDYETTWNGRPSLRMFKRSLDERGYKTRGAFGVFYPPSSSEPVKMTFSLYARGEKPGAALMLRAIKGEKTFNLTEEWQRYHLTFDLPPGETPNLGARDILMVPARNNIAVWVSGLQIERGEIPTEFQDDSVPVKKKVASDPDNLLKNPNAESASVEHWEGLENLKYGEFGIRRGVGRSGEYAFCWRGQSSGIKSDWVAIDTNKSYKMSGWFKAAAGNVTGLIFGVVFADAQKRTIKWINFNSIKESQTQLIHPCRASDTTLRIQNGLKWQAGAIYAVGFGVEENQLVFDLTPPGIQEVRQEGDEWVVVLNQPCGFDKSAGTMVVENRSGNNGIFFPDTVNAVISNEWTEFQGEIKPDRWWPGTAYARIVLTGPALKYGKTEKMLLMDDFSFRQVCEN
ncbi:MAG: hypothetical protein ACOYCD_10245 [Kiritimatiellia bacterium]|jgi:hypothetical protein